MSRRAGWLVSPILASRTRLSAARTRGIQTGYFECIVEDDVKKAGVVVTTEVYNLAHAGRTAAAFTQEAMPPPLPIPSAGGDSSRTENNDWNAAIYSEAKREIQQLASPEFVSDG